jgi:nucleotide-binding universal stress UspA family protein
VPQNCAIWGLIGGLDAFFAGFVMKNILALIGGGPRDQVIFDTALAAAMPFAAHVNFLHIHVSAGEAALGTRTEFAVGPAVGVALRRLEERARTYSRVAADHIRDLCENSVVPINDAADVGRNSVTASYCEETDQALKRLSGNALHNDLIVIGRLKQTQGLPSHTLEHLIRRSRRPMLVAASGSPSELTGTAIVFWDGSESATHAVEAAKPLLTKARRVVVTRVLDRRKPDETALTEIVRELADSDIKAEPLPISADWRDLAVRLAAAADECKADLVVMGAYGRGMVRELLFGSRTEALLRSADRPILLVH